MAKQANRMMIGGFVVIAVILLAASLVVFGSGKFFKKTEEFILFFDSSVKGLSVGAPVLFQGVQIGSVKSITLTFDTQEIKAEIPVIVEVEPDRFHLIGGQQRTEEDRKVGAQQLIAKGLRAVLTLQSFITGQLMIELDFHPDTPVNLKSIGKEYTQIPTIPSTTQRLGQALQKVDLEEIQDHLKNALTGIDRFVNNPDLVASVKTLRKTLEESQQFVKKIDGKIDPLADNLNRTMSDARKLVNNVDRQVGPLAENLNTAVKDFDKLARDADARLTTLMISLDKTLSAFRGVVSPDAPLIFELESTLQEISAMARSFRQLADYLERHPEALIQGKGESGGK